MLFGQRILVRICAQVIAAVVRRRGMFSIGVVRVMFLVNVKVEVERLEGNEAESGTSIRWFGGMRVALWLGWRWCYICPRMRPIAVEVRLIVMSFLVVVRCLCCLLMVVAMVVAVNYSPERLVVEASGRRIWLR